jgi:DNA-directed RNA polymerase I subunit RPA2
VESFNYFLNVGLAAGIRCMERVELELVDPKKVRASISTPAATNTIDWNETTTVECWIENVKILKPVKPDGLGRSNRLYPRECRERRVHYAAPIHGQLCFNIVQRRNGSRIPGRPIKLARQFGELPIMVMSQACHLHGMTSKQLVQHNEEVRVCDNELGRVIRN